MSPWETALDRARRIHASRLRQIREEKYASQEQERAKVEEAQYQDRMPIVVSEDPVELRARCAEGEWNITTKSGTVIYNQKSGTYRSPQGDEIV